MLQRILNRLRALLRSTGPVRRTSGRPTSANGASSLHLAWELPPGTFVSVSVDLEVVVPPAVPDLYFWAVQANFGDASTETGGAHLGLQWNRRHPGSTAVNWGGYHTRGGLLEGTPSPLPSAPNDPNTRDFPWKPERAYRLEISPTPDRPGWWQGAVTDLDTGGTSVVRDLHGGGDRIRFVTMWSEVFARCDAPSVTVRWSRLRLRSAVGDEVSPEGVTVNYQSHAAGGCSNSTAGRDGSGFSQTTSVERVIPQGARLQVS